MKLLAACLVLSATGLLHGAEPKAQRDVPYCQPNHSRQTLDVFAPAEGSNHPIILWIHGGGWESRDKKDVKHKPQAFVDKGYVFVSVNYRLLGDGVTIQDMAGDVAKAIRWTRDHAKDLGGDPDSFIIMGHSAGAQLSALICTDDRYLKAEKLSLSIIKGCVPVDGDTYDVPMRIQAVEKPRAKIIRRKFGDEASQKELSAVTHVARDKKIPPFLVLHVAEHPGTTPQTQRLVQVLKEAQISARAYAAEGKDHESLCDDLGLAGDRPTEAVYEFLKSVLKK